MTKRSTSPGPSRKNKKIKTVPVAFTLKYQKKEEKDEFESAANISLPTHTEISLLEIRNKFPSERFIKKFPPVFFAHQVTDYRRNTLIADKDIEELEKAGKIKAVNIGFEVAILFIEDLTKFYKENFKISNRKVIRFIENIWPTLPCIDIEKSVLKETHSLTDRDISEIIHTGFLVLQDESYYSLSFPGAGEFMKLFHKGRNAVLKAIERSKYKEMLVCELESRSMHKTVEFGINYQMADIIGAKLVECVETTSGTLLRHISSARKR